MPAKASFLTRPVENFQLIETMLLLNGNVFFLQLHLERLALSAEYFDFAFDMAAIEARIAERITSLPSDVSYRIRLLLHSTGEVTLTHTALTDEGHPWRVRISRHRIGSKSFLRRHKTTRRQLYDTEYARARKDGFDEVLFLNERDELAEGAITTLFVKVGGKLFTPPLAAGVLPGVLRRHLLETDTDVAERTLVPDDLRTAEAVFWGTPFADFALSHASKWKALKATLCCSTMGRVTDTKSCFGSRITAFGLSGSCLSFSQMERLD